MRKKVLTFWFNALFEAIVLLLILLVCGIQGLSIFFYIWYYTFGISLALILLVEFIKYVKKVINK